MSCEEANIIPAVKHLDCVLIEWTWTPISPFSDHRSCCHISFCQGLHPLWLSLQGNHRSRRQVEDRIHPGWDRLLFLFPCCWSGPFRQHPDFSLWVSVTQPKTTWAKHIMGWKINHSSKNSNLRPVHCRMTFSKGEMDVILLQATRGTKVCEEVRSQMEVFLGWRTWTRLAGWVSNMSFIHHPTHRPLQWVPSGYLPSV